VGGAKTIGLTGGIGSGKTTVARMLEARGAVVFDADLLAREAIEPGTPGYERVVERFGPNVLEPGGGIDREALAAVVFADPAARRDLEAITHPEIRRLFAEGTEAYRDTDAVVVFSAPLLVETGMHTAFEVLVVVSAPAGCRSTAHALMGRPSRLSGEDRGAAPLEERAEAADIPTTTTDAEELERQVDACGRASGPGGDLDDRHR
jgi:dephospho-CoA kinase